MALTIAMKAPSAAVRVVGSACASVARQAGGMAILVWQVGGAILRGRVSFREVVAHGRSMGRDPVSVLAAIRQRMRVTAVVVTDDIEQAVGISRQIALLAHGTVRFVGTADEFGASQDPVVWACADRRAATAAALEIMVEA